MIESASQTDGAITLTSLYSPEAAERINYGGSPVRVVAWIDDDHYLQEDAPAGGGGGAAGGRSGGDWMKVHAINGDIEPAVDIGAVEAALGGLAGITDDDASRLARTAATGLARGALQVLLNHANDLFVVSHGSGDGAAFTAERLTYDPQPEVGEELSPDGKFVSFVRDYNLHLIDVESGRERALTSDGSDELFYGRLDWVYQEEIYGRGNFKAYWWSPDSTHLAYLRLDESPVKEFVVVNNLPNNQTIEVTNYPLAGDPNPTVTLGIVKAIGGDTVWVDTSKYASMEHLIVNVAWHPTGDRLVYQVQDREQRWLDLNMGNLSNGNATTLFRETTPAFVQEMGAPRWLDDGSFLWFSERTGYKHLYHYAFDRSDIPALRRQITDGEWEVRNLHGVDEEGGWVYFSGIEHSPIASQVYRVRLAGRTPNLGLTRLSTAGGTHTARFNPSLTRYVDTWSDVRTPPQLRVHAGDSGELLRVVDANPTPQLAELRLGEVELRQVPTRDGFLMETMIIRPPDFDPSKTYPVLQYNYGGPHAPVVRNSWGGNRYLWHQMLAQQGFIIWYCDNRSASGKGIKPTWEAYMQLGVVELRDIEDGIAWLKANEPVDPERIGIWGWSYGGFMASYALTHSQTFSYGIAGAPVTDWHLYDTIYTERYMRMPQNNQEGYDQTSVVKAAGNLHGNLLLLHGTIDDNVHLQNSMQLIYGLERAGKDFDMKLYPASRHGVRDPRLVWDLQREMTDFVLDGS